MFDLCRQCPESNKRFAAMRGLCRPCYGRLAKAVRLGRASWAELERTGLVLPAGKPGSGWRGRLLPESAPAAETTGED